MKAHTRFPLLCFFLSFYTAFVWSTPFITLKEAIDVRAKALANQYNIDFGESLPLVSFEIPQGEEARFFSAAYNPGNSSFSFNPEYENILFSKKEIEKETLFVSSDTTLLAVIRQAIDHELGHFFSDKVSREKGLGEWPPAVSTELSSGTLAIELLSEGIAEYFGRTSLKDKREEEIFFPEREDSLLLREYEDFTYDGGYWLVKPLCDAFGVLPVVEYIVSHPLIVSEGNMKRAVYAYWENAFRDLK